MREEYDLTIYEYLKTKLPIVYITTTGDETNIRCPFCGDSTKDPRHAHLYINNKEPFKYFCQKCSTSGIVDEKFLSMLNLYDPEIFNYVKKAKHKYLKSINTKYNGTFFGYFNKELDFTPDKLEKIEMKKLNYINKRLGINIQNNEDLAKFKIILNVENFFEKNKIQQNKYYQANLKMLNQNYIGFLSNDRNMISFRNLYENSNKPRCINKKIYNENYFQSRKFYSIENYLNIERTVYNIYLAEGIFDILGVYFHIYNGTMNDNDLFFACNGKSYNLVLNYLKSLAILNCNINIFSDNDVSIKTFSDLMKRNEIAKFNGMNIFYNKMEKEKDFGVTKDRILLSDPYIL